MVLPSEAHGIGCGKDEMMNLISHDRDAFNSNYSSRHHRDATLWVSCYLTHPQCLQSVKPLQNPYHLNLLAVNSDPRVQ